MERSFAARCTHLSSGACLPKISYNCIFVKNIKWHTKRMTTECDKLQHQCTRRSNTRGKPDAHDPHVQYRLNRTSDIWSELNGEKSIKKPFPYKM